MHCYSDNYSNYSNVFSPYNLRSRPSFKHNMSDSDEEMASPPVKKQTHEMPKAFKPYTEEKTYSMERKFVF